jgi:hypothetical protein
MATDPDDDWSSDGADGVEQIGRREALDGHVQMSEVASADTELAPQIVGCRNARENLDRA